jgi:GNAT superfamily N-acetyltransferase
LTIVPLNPAVDVPSPEPDAQRTLERRDLDDRVLSLMRSLPEGERLAAILYYIAGYTQAEIGACLGLPAGAIAKRLFSARRRLRRLAVERLANRLRGARPSRDTAFEERVSSALRPSSDRDWVPVGALAYACQTGEREECDVWLRNRRSFDAARRIRHHYVVEREGSGEILGYGAIEQSVYRPRYAMYLLVDPQWLEDGVGDLLFDRLMADLRDAGAITVSVQDSCSRDDLRAFLEARGFSETGRVWDLRLQIADARDDETAIDGDLTARGITIATFADERQRDPDCVRKLYELTTALAADVPGASTVSAPQFDLREALIWLEQPYVLPDGYFIARQGDEYIGVCDVHLRGAAPGQVVHGFTGVRHDRRRQGIATALKRRAVDYAREAGYRTIRTNNRPTDGAMMALNERLGFRRRFSHVTLERCLRPIVTRDPREYDAYVGRYRDRAETADRTFVVTKEEDRLFAEFLGQKVELFPDTGTTFFVKWFYGRAEFTGNDACRADSLIWRQGPPSGAEVTLWADRIE